MPSVAITIYYHSFESLFVFPDLFLESLVPSLGERLSGQIHFFQNMADDLCWCHGRISFHAALDLKVERKRNLLPIPSGMINILRNETK